MTYYFYSGYWLCDNGEQIPLSGIKLGEEHETPTQVMHELRKLMRVDRPPGRIVFTQFNNVH